MTPDERNLLGRFLQDLGQARGGLKDAEAAGMIDRTVAANPDAAYLLVQHAIIADQALHAAQARVSELETQAGQVQGAGSFLGGGPWAGAPSGGAQVYGQPGYGQPGYGQGAYAPPPPRQGGVLGGLFGGGGAPTQPGGFGSFLRSAGTMAAGVAGGEVLFSGLSNMFGGGHGGFGGGFGGAPVENVTINEYGDDRGDPGGSSYDDGGYNDGGFDDGGVT